MQVHLTPDGRWYLHMAHGRLVPKPFHVRVAMPMLLGTDAIRWAWCTRILMCILPLLMGLFVWQRTLSWPAALFAVAVTPTIPGWQFWWRCPVLVDIPALFLGLLVAVMPVGIAAGIVVGLSLLVRETAPLFAALYASTPVFAVPLLLYPLISRFIASSDALADARLRNILARPFHHAWRLRRIQFIQPALTFFPWGGLLLAAFNPSWLLLIAVMVAYAQTLRAQDFVRLYALAAPILILSVAQMSPTWLVLAAFLSWLNPWRKEFA